MRIGMKRRLKNSDDDENESEQLQSLLVSNYHLVDDDDELECFSALPIHWNDSECFDFSDDKGSTFLHGIADNGLQKIFMQVIAWRFDLSGAKPEVSLLSKDSRWIKLQKPRKSFLDTVRTALITIYFLHRVKKNPRISAKGIWNNLVKNKDLSSYGFKPSGMDLLDHMPLIGEAAKKDAVLAQSKLLLKVLEKPGNQKPSVEEVDDIDNDIIDNANEDLDSEDDLSNSVCSFCDNGGNLLCCDGGCKRSFHATKEDGQEAFCDSLGFTKKEVDEIEIFYCKNCEYHQHQCFACGKLGSSDKVKGAEVFKCATCDCFYHPRCISKLLPRVLKHVSEELEKIIADGDPFTCPIHYCWVCKGLENEIEPEMQFAVCRRCPKSYHRKCLPREIAFDGIDDEDIKPRAWEGLLPNDRILIYCLNHEIVDELGTPIRDHIKFPDTRATVDQEINTPKKRMKPATEKIAILKKKSVDFDNSSSKATAKRSKVPGKLSSSQVGSKNSSQKMVSGSDISMKLKSNVISSSCPTENKKSISKKVEMPNCEENTQPAGEKICALMNKNSKRIKHDDRVNDVDNETLLVKPVRSVLPPLDADSERRNHGIDDELGTPIRDHKKFPDAKATVVREINTTKKRMKPATEKRAMLEKKSVDLDNSSGKSTAKGSKVPGKLSASRVGSKKLSEKMVSGSDISKKLKSNVISSSCPTENKKSTSKKVEMPNCEENKQPAGAKLCALINKDSKQKKHDDRVNDVDNETLLVTPIKSVLPTLDADSEKRNHEVNDELGTPIRDHKKFPDTKATVREINTTNKRMKPAIKKRALLEKKSVGSDNLSGKSTVKGSKVPGKLSSSKDGSKKLSEKGISGSVVSMKLKSNEISRSCLTENKKSISKKVEVPNCEENKQLTGEKLCALMSKGSEQIKHDNRVNDVDNETLSIKPIRSVLPPSNASQRSLSDLFKEARSSILSEDVGNADQENHRGHEYRMSKYGKTSLKRKHTEDNDRTGLGIASLAKRQAVNGVQGPSAANPFSDCGATNTKEHHKMGEEKHRRESDISQEVEVQNPNCDHLSGRDPSCGNIGHSLAHLSPVTEPSDKMNTQAVQPYVSHEDELNHVRMSSLGPKPPIFNRCDTSERCVPLPGFAPGLNLAYSRTNSAGWLEE